MHICIYIYIERERDLVVVVRQQLAVAWPLRGQSQKCTSKGIGRRGIVLKYRMSLHTNNIYAYTYIYIYIYIYVCPGARGPARGSSRLPGRAGTPSRPVDMTTYQHQHPHHYCYCYYYH